MGNGDSAEHHWAVPRERVDIEAHAGPGSEAAREPFFGAAEVGSGRQLFERGIAFYRGDAQSGGADDGALVGGRLSLPVRIGLAERVEPERLRRLDTDEAGTVGGLLEAIGCARQRVADGENRCGAFEEFERRQQPVDDRGRAEGAGGVMDQHRLAVDRVQPGAHGIGALVATGNELADGQAVEGGRGQLFLSRADHDSHFRQCGMRDQGLGRPAQHRLAAQQAKLLGHAAAEAFAFAGGDDEGGGGHGGRV